MDDDALFAMFLASVGSMQFHPRNAEFRGSDTDVVAASALVADEMLRQLRLRYPKEV